MYLALFWMNVGMYFFYPAGPGGPGPRYLLTYLPFLILAVVDLHRWIYCEGTPTARRLWKFGLVCLFVGNAAFAARESYTMYGRRELDRMAKRTGAGEKIFFLKSGTYQTGARDLTRNPPDLSTAANLYFIWCDQPKRDALLKRFPGRQIFVYEYPARLDPYIPDRKM
jgi:hypothetical protein